MIALWLLAAAVHAAPVVPTAMPLLPAPTQAITVPLIVERFEGLDQSMKSLSADFRQTVRWEQTGMSQSVVGTLEFRKPDLLRLQHKQPEAQTLVSDGTWLWIYRESTNQAIKTSFSEWKKSEPMAQGLLDFGNYAGLLRTYDVSIATMSAPGPDGHRSLTLSLKPHNTASGKDFRLYLTMSTRDFFPADTELRAGGAVVASHFSNIRYNSILPDTRFQFTPPPGADVFDNFKSPKAK